MDAQAAERKFQEADALFREGRHRDALRLLQEVNDAYPNNRRVVWAMARCHQAVGQTQAALDACEYLIQRWDYNRAHRMKARLLAESRQQTQTPGTGAVGGGLDVAPPPPMPPGEAQREGPDWKRIGLIGGGVLAVLVVLAVLPFLARPGSGAGSETATQWSGVAVVVFLIVGQFLGGVGVLYVALMVLGKLLHDTFVENLLDVALFALIVGVVGLVPVVGWIIGLVILSNHYDMSCGELLLFVLLQAGLGLLVFFLIGAVTGVGMLGVLETVR